MRSRALARSLRARTCASLPNICARPLLHTPPAPRRAGKDDGPNLTNCEDNFGSVTQVGASFLPKPAYMAALAAQTGVGNASTFVGRVPATIIGAPSAWGLTAESAFVLAFAGGDLPQPAAAFAVYTNVRAVVASDAGRGRPAISRH